MRGQVPTYVANLLNKPSFCQDKITIIEDRIIYSNMEEYFNRMKNKSSDVHKSGTIAFSLVSKLDDTVRYLEHKSCKPIMI